MLEVVTERLAKPFRTAFLIYLNVEVYEHENCVIHHLTPTKIVTKQKIPKQNLTKHKTQNWCFY